MSGEEEVLMPRKEEGVWVRGKHGSGAKGKKEMMKLFIQQFLTKMRRRFEEKPCGKEIDASTCC